MWIRSSSQISDNIFQVVTPVSSHFLICGANRCALVDSGVLGLGLVKAVKDALALNGRSLEYVLITHADADHIGGIAELRKAFPKVIVAGSSLLKERLEDKTLLEQLYDRNLSLSLSFDLSPDSLTEVVSKEDWLLGTKIDKTLENDESLDLGGVAVKAYAFPGHTLEQMGYYVEDDKALAAGEAFGYYGGKNKEAPTFRFYTEYLDSLNKASELPVRLLSLPHNGVLTGDLVVKFIHKSIASAKAFRERINEKVSGGEIAGTIYVAILEEWEAEDIAPEGPFVLEREFLLRDMITSLTGK